MDELKRTIPRAEWKNSGAWNYWLVTLIFNTLFCFMHFLNYEYNPQLYAATVFGINLPWTLSCVRNFIVVADTHWERRFVIAYEIIVRQPFFRNRESPPLAPFFLTFRTFLIIGLSPSYICSKCLYSYSTFHILLSDSFVQKKKIKKLKRPFKDVVLQVFSILGFQQSTWFTLMLLDVVNNSPLLMDIVRAATNRSSSLVLVFYIFLVTIVIYATWGLSEFQEYLVVPTADDSNNGGGGGIDDDDDSNAEVCASSLSCFFFLFYSQIAGGAGSIHDSLQTVNMGTPDYLKRMLFDSVFFVWVGIILMNIITGLLVDEFGAMREAEAQRWEILESQCFMCGMERAYYEDLGLGNGISFRQHQTEEHDCWRYVSYMAYLDGLDSTELNGVETYIQQQLEAKNFDWIPSKTSAAIERAMEEGTSIPGASVANGASREVEKADGDAGTDAGNAFAMSRQEFLLLREGIDELRELAFGHQQRTATAERRASEVGPR